MRSGVTECGSLQHNYSNISPVATVSQLSQASQEREHDMGHHGPASLASTNMSQEPPHQLPQPPRTPPR